MTPREEMDRVVAVHNAYIEAGQPGLFGKEYQAPPHGDPFFAPIVGAQWADRVVDPDEVFEWMRANGKYGIFCMMLVHEAVMRPDPTGTTS